jgi:histidine phosphotransferase ChpT
LSGKSDPFWETPMSAELRLAELLISRLCHDLISPVGAAANGVELVEEFGDDMGEDAQKLIATSVRQASSKLAFFRMAYGSAGNDSNLTLGEAHALATGLILGSKVGLDWPLDGAASRRRLGPRGVKLVLATVGLAVEALPKGGRIAVSVDAGGGNATGTVLAQGQGARLDLVAERGIALGLDPGLARSGLAELDAKGAPACYAAQLARSLGGTLHVTVAADRVGFAIPLPDSDA